MRCTRTLKPIILCIFSLITVEYLLTGSIYSTEMVISGFNLNKEIFMGLAEIVAQRGYCFNEYKVETEDGYILTLQRVGRGASNRSLPVFLQHGLLTSSVDWLIGPKSLAYALVDAGYDVWLGNVRGNIFSRKHRSWSAEDESFWNFTWEPEKLRFHEYAQYDLTAMVRFVLRHTTKPQLVLVGHSQGGLISFLQISRDPEFARKIGLFVALAPAIYIRGTRSPFTVLSPYFRHFYMAGKKYFLRPHIFVRFMGRSFCLNKVLSPLCLFIIGHFNGFNTQNIDMTQLPSYLQFQPSSTSMKNMVHYAQLIMHGRLDHYDYMSRETNFRHYDSASPPPYNISQLTIPTIVIASHDDWVCPPANVKKFIRHLSDVRKVIWLDDFSHLDFVIGRRSYEKVYSPLVELVNDQLK